MNKFCFNPLNVTKENIWNYKQNKIRYIVKDILHLVKGCHFIQSLWFMNRLMDKEMPKCPNINEENIRKILMARGINKWLANRSDIVSLKDKWKKEITVLQSKIQLAKKSNCVFHIAVLKGELKTLVRCRKELKKICHSQRWRPFVK